MRIDAVIGCALILSMGCACSGGQSTAGAASSPAAPAPNPTSAAATAEPASRGLSMPKRAGADALTIDGERYTVRTVYDRQLQNMPVFLFVAPEHWRDQSEVSWNYANLVNPTTTWTKVENPANAEAFYLYPGLTLFWLNNNVRLRPGQNDMGMVFAHPMPATATIAAFAQQLHGREPGFEVVGSKMLPGLAEALQVPRDGTQRQGVGVKVRYTFNGQPVDEEFYGLYYNVNVPAGGGIYQTDWGLQMLHSFRAPAGTLDKRRAVFAAIPKSIRRNPAWNARYDGIMKYLNVQYQQALQAGYDNIAAAGRLSQQLTANSNAMLASVDASLASGRSGGGASGGGGVDKFDDLVRGVETTDDPYYGTSQHSTNESYHWTDGYGGYRDTNDAGANPNVTEGKGSWTLMQPSR